MPDLEVYVAKFHKDKPLSSVYSHPARLIPVQAGASLAPLKVADIQDNVGDNISVKNVNYCELTVLYCIWKNRLAGERDKSGKYYGLFHYRRYLDLRNEDLCHLAARDIDAILPFPTIHEPNIKEHHARYIKESDWEAMLRSLEEIEPEYYAAYDKIFSQQYMYNYNIIIAKAAVLQEYCEWLFPILERVEELSIPKGSERADRYIGYIGENLLTLYFLYHKDRMNLVHTGRIMLT